MTRKINQMDLDILFYEELSQLQLSQMFNIILILAEYMFLSTDMLMYLYKQKYKENMGLSYLKRAVKEKVIIEYQHDLYEKSEEKNFYYALKPTTYHYLNQNHISYIKIPPNAAYEEKARILTFNKFILEKGYVPSFRIPHDFKYRFFGVNPNIICYFPKLISVSYIKSMFSSEKDGLKDIVFKEIEMDIINIGKHTKAVHPKDIDTRGR